MMRSHRIFYPVLAIVVGLAVLASASLAATAQSNDQADALLREAMHVEISDGDLERAIELYRTIVERHGNARPVAAQALLRIGMSYEKLGMLEARAAFEELLSDYGDQADAVAEARSRLASLQSDDETERSQGIVTRQLWPKAPAQGGSREEMLGGISPDGRYVAFVGWGLNRDLAVYDTETGRRRRV